MTDLGAASYCTVCGQSLVEQFVPQEERERLVCSQCGHIHYINPKIVAGTIPIQDGGVWLLRRAIEPRLGAWTFPAGFMEMGESVKDAATRETMEELNLQVKLGPLLNVYSRSITSTVHIVYLAEAISTPSAGKETLDFALFAPDSIPWDDLAFWSTHEALRDWIAVLSRLR